MSWKLTPPVLLAVCLFASLAEGAGGYYRSGWFANGYLSARYDDNVSRSQADSDIKEDFVTNARARAGYRKSIGNTVNLSASLDAEYENFADFDDLNNYRFGAGVDLTFQPVRTFRAPWFSAFAKLSSLDFDDSAIRSGTLFETGAGIGLRVTDRILGRAGYAFTQRTADERAVFETDDHAFETSVDYQLTNRITLFANYDFHIGEVVSNATPTAAIIREAEAVAPDDAFTTGLGPGCMNRRCAYRVDALTHRVGGGIDFALAERASLDISMRFLRVDADRDIYYQGLAYSANLYLRF
ncbi:MAG: hypothetical protein AAF384_08460 [Pseudomonadota bacterium]